MQSNKMLLVLLVLGFSVAVLAGCSDPKAASKSNFEKVAEAYFKLPENNRFCFSLPASDPMVLMWYGALADDKNAIVVKEGTAQDEKLELLEKVGLLSRENRKAKTAFPTYRYRLTEKAQPFQGAPGVLCYAKVKFMEVKDFSSPASFLGKTISEATLVLRYEDIADWVKDRNVQIRWLGKDSDLAAPRITKKVFVLMNDGWKVD